MCFDSLSPVSAWTVLDVYRLLSVQQVWLRDQVQESRNLNHSRGFGLRDGGASISQQMSKPGSEWGSAAGGQSGENISPEARAKGRSWGHGAEGPQAPRGLTPREQIAQGSWSGSRRDHSEGASWAHLLPSSWICTLFTGSYLAGKLWKELSKGGSTWWFIHCPEWTK